MSQIFFCQFDDHENDPIVGFCLNKQCECKPQCCIQCVRKKHNDHPDDCKSFSKIKKMIEQYIQETSQFQQYINTLMESFQKLIAETIKKTKKTFEKLTSLHQTLVDLNYSQFNKELLKTEYSGIQHEQKKSDLDFAFCALCKKIQELIIDDNEIPQISDPSAIISAPIIKFISMGDLNLNPLDQSYSLPGDQEVKAGNLSYYKGKTLMNQLQYNDAIVCFDKAIQVNKINYEAYLNKGHSLINIERYSEALQCYRKAVQLNDHIDTKKEIGKYLNHFGKQDEAINFYNQALRKDPSRTDILNLIAKILKEQSKFEEALNCYDKILSFDPFEENAYIQKCSILIDLMQLDEAIKVDEQQKKLNPSSRFNEVQIQKGNALREEKNYKESIQFYEQALQINPLTINAYINKGFVLREQSKYEEALRCYDDAIKINPTNTEIYFNKGIMIVQKGNTLFSLEKYKEAIENYDKAIQYDPRNIKAYNNKGNALTNIHKYNEAIIEQNIAIKLDPNKADTYVNKGLTLEKLNQYREAIQCYELAKQKGGPQELDEWIEDLRRLI